MRRPRPNAPARRAGPRASGYACVLLLLVLAACERAGDRPAPVATAVAANESKRAAVSSWGSFYVVYRPTLDPIPLNQMFGLSVNVYEANDHARPVADTMITVDARMPEHNHGMTLQPQVTADGAGNFRVDGMLFHMPGRWELYVDVARGTELERATFEITLD